MDKDKDIDIDIDVDGKDMQQGCFQTSRQHGVLSSPSYIIRIVRGEIHPVGAEQMQRKTATSKNLCPTSLKKSFDVVLGAIEPLAGLAGNILVIFSVGKAWGSTGGPAPEVGRVLIRQTCVC